MRRQGGHHGRRRGRVLTIRREQNKHDQKKKKTLEDYWFYVGSNKQASDCDATQEFIANHIKRTCARGNDIAKALRKLEAPDTDTWKLSLNVSTSADIAELARENKQFELDCEAEFGKYMKRRRGFKDNTCKACTEI